MFGTDIMHITAVHCYISAIAICTIFSLLLVFFRLNNNNNSSALRILPIIYLQAITKIQYWDRTNQTLHDKMDAKFQSHQSGSMKDL